MVCYYEMEIIIEMIEKCFADSLFLFTQRPDSMGSDEGAEQLDAIQTAIQQGKPSHPDLQHSLKMFLSQMTVLFLFIVKS